MQKKFKACLLFLRGFQFSWGIRIPHAYKCEQQKTMGTWTLKVMVQKICSLRERWERWPYMRDSKRDTDVKNRLLDSLGEGEGGMTWENCIETYILSYVKRIPSPGSPVDTWDRVLGAGVLGWPRRIGWGGRWVGDSGWGTHVHPWLIHVNVWQKALQYCN